MGDEPEAEENGYDRRSTDRQIAVAVAKLADTDEAVNRQVTFLSQLINTIQQARRRTLVLVGVGFVLILLNLIGILALVNNAVSSTNARDTLLKRSAIEDKTLKDVSKTLDLVQRALDPTSDIGQRQQTQAAAFISNLTCQIQFAIRHPELPVPQPCIPTK